MNDTFFLISFNEYLRQEKVEYLENSVAQLSKDEKDEYFKLHDCKCFSGKIKEMPEKMTMQGLLFRIKEICRRNIQNQ